MAEDNFLNEVCQNVLARLNGQDNREVKGQRSHETNSMRGDCHS